MSLIDQVTHRNSVTVPTTAIGHQGRRLDDSRYPVTTHAPHGRASSLCSPASRSTRANLAAALGPRPNAVLDVPNEVQGQGRPPVDHDRSRRARSSPRGTCRSGRDHRSRPSERDAVNRLRDPGTSPWRKSDVAHPAVLPERDTPGRLAVGSSQRGPQRTGLDSAWPPRCAHLRTRPTAEQSSVLRQAVERIAHGLAPVCVSPRSAASPRVQRGDGSPRRSR